MINLHAGRQTFDFDCGAKALQLVMAYYGEDVREDILLDELATYSNGTSPEMMVKVAEARGFGVKAGTGWTIEQMGRYLDALHPVIVLLQAWADREMTLGEWKKSWDNGHYAILINMASDVLLFEDPASFRKTWLKKHEFLVRWHDLDLHSGEQLHHFAMVLTGRVPAVRTVEHMG